jgi:hypothetical protein
MEDLASHGYVVISVAHRGEARFVFDGEGEIEFLDRTVPRYRAIMAEQNSPESRALFEQMAAARSAEEQLAVFRRSTEAMPTLLRASPRIWADDVAFVIDRLGYLNSRDGLLAGALDTTNVGVFGMSLGGVAAGQACVRDSRIAAGLNIDGGLYGDLLDSVIPGPFMFMNSDRYRGYEEVLVSHVRGTCYVMVIQGSDHYDFTDHSVLDRDHMMIGEIDGPRMQEIVAVYTRAFFDRHLKGTDSSLLDGESDSFPEVTFTVHPKAAAASADPPP